VLQASEEVLKALTRWELEYHLISGVEFTQDVGELEYPSATLFTF